MSASTLSEIIEKWGGLIQTGPFGSQLHQHDYSEDGIPVVMPKDIRNGRIDESGIARIPESKANQLSRHYLKAGSVVFPRRGEIRKCAYITEEQAGFLCGTGCIKIEPPEERLRSKFLFYYLGLRQSVEWLERNAVGTTMLNLNTKILGGLKVPLSSTKKQDEIIDILATYDDLIENNRRRIQLLEQAARLLYKEWFVHLRFPGHEHVKIKDGVPEGWDNCPIKKVIAGLYDGPHATPLPADSGPIFLGIKNITNSGRLDLKSIRCIAENDYPRWTKRVTPQAGDIVFSYEATLNRYALIPKGFRGCLGRRLALIRPKQTERTGYFLFLTFFEDRWRATIEKNKLSGATVDRIPLAKFPEFPILVPTKQLLAAFDDYVSPLYLQMELIEKMNFQLAQARDLLLPKLMNGEVTV
mgnify:CR=1 FL=1